MLVELMIAQICAGMPQVDHNACTKALQAASIQTQFQPNMNAAEQKFQAIVQNQVEDMTGAEAVGAALYIAKVAREKEIKFRLVKEKDVIPSVSATGGQNGGRIDFGWHF